MYPNRSCPVLSAARYLCLLMGLAGPGLMAAGAQSETYMCALVTNDFYVGKSENVDDGLYKAVGGGKWRHIGFNDPSIMNVAFDPRDPNQFYVASVNGCMRTRDGGKTWWTVTSWDMTEPRDVCVDPDAPDDVYLALPDGIGISLDQGQTWSRKESGMPLRGRYTQSLQCDLLHAGRVLAGCEHGIYLTENLKDGWRRVLETSATVDDVRQSPGDPARWYAVTQSDGAWTSEDGGRSWTRLAGVPGLRALYNVSVSATDPNVVAIASWTYGVYVSEDAGKTWDLRNAGLPAGHHVWRVGIDPTSGRLYASAWENPVFFSDDRGRDWKSTGFECSRVNSFVFLAAGKK